MAREPALPLDVILDRSHSRPFLAPHRVRSLGTIFFGEPVPSPADRA